MINAGQPWSAMDLDLEFNSLDAQREACEAYIKSQALHTKARPNDTSACWASLAFISSRIIAAIIDGTAPADLTIAGLAKALPDSWTEQERQFGLTRA